MPSTNPTAEPSPVPETNALADITAGVLPTAEEILDATSALVLERSRFGLSTRPVGTPNGWVFIETEHGILAVPAATVAAIEARR